MAVPLAHEIMDTILTDTHCHLEMDAFTGDRAEIIKRAGEAGVQTIITIGSDRESNIQGLRICQDFSGVYAAVGIHPHDAKTYDNSVDDEIRTWTKDRKVVAVGEIGLDYHYMHSPKEVQKEVFRKQLLIARETSLPVVVHSREASDDTIGILQEHGEGLTGVLHCFSGSRETARRAIELGFHLSIAGPVTFKNARKLREVAASIPDDLLLLETDAPYLSPEPMRGKRNEPSYLRYTAEAVARLRGVSLEDIGRITTLNAARLFRTGEAPSMGEIAYKIRNSLYLNITNRCTNRCGFCVKFQKNYVKGHNLKIEQEPSVQEIIDTVHNPSSYKEIVFCGLGEPFIRLDALKEVSRWIKRRGGRVRVNTNGHANLIHGRNILPELSGLVDSLSVSIDAHDQKTYDAVCSPSYKNAFKAVLDFIQEAKKYIPEVKVTVVNIPEVDIDKCRALAQDLGVELRVREFDVVG